ncbi:MAG: hypothetical protein ACTSP9_08090 [Promethearchaeota archaeon]
MILIDLSILETIQYDLNKNDINSIFSSLLDEVTLFLDLNPFQKSVRLEFADKTDEGNFSNFGVNRILKNGVFIVRIDESKSEFIRFIMLREVFLLFIPNEYNDSNVIYSVINKIVERFLVNDPNLNKWKSLTQENLEPSEDLPKGFDWLIDFDRSDIFFKHKITKNSPDPVKFFFYFLRRNPSLVIDSIDDIYAVFFNQFVNYISHSMDNEEILETIRCIKYIFYAVKRYKDLLGYKELFKKLKENGQLITTLSLRKFTKTMYWIKNFSFIGPSYQINWNSLNVAVFILFLKFNPKLEKTKVYDVIETFPFFIAPKIALSSSSIELWGYVVIPKVYKDDFNDFLKKLNLNNYITNFYSLLLISKEHIVNLNYFKNHTKNQRIIDPTHRNYDRKLEIEFKISFNEEFKTQKLKPLDFLLLDRIRWFSVTGFGFERREENLKIIKSDILNEIAARRSFITGLKANLRKFYRAEEFRKQAIDFLEKNKLTGNFYLKNVLGKYLKTIHIIDVFLEENKNLKNIEDLKSFITNQSSLYFYQNILALTDKSIIDFLLKDLYLLYFKSKNLYKKKIQLYKDIFELINFCHSLKIYNLNTIIQILQEEKLVNILFNKKDASLVKFYETYKIKEINTAMIDEIFDRFLKTQPPVIAPLLLNTIITKGFETDYFHLVLIDSEDTKKKLAQIRYIFPRILISKTKDMISNNYLYHIEISVPFLKEQEKTLLFSNFYNLFKNKITYGKNLIWSGVILGFSLKDFYDYDTNNFFYSEELFKNYSQYVSALFDSDLNSFPINKLEIKDKLWSKEKDFFKLVTQINKNSEIKNMDLNNGFIEAILKFHTNLKDHILNEKSFKEVKDQFFFRNHIKSLKFFPLFQKFHIKQQFLYVSNNSAPSEIIKFFKESIQSLEYIASLDDSLSFLIKFISKSEEIRGLLSKFKEITDEFFFFSIKKTYQIFQFLINLRSNKWNYDSTRFKSHIYDVFLKSSDKTDLNLNEFKNAESNYEYDFDDIEALSHIYNYQSIDIKSYIGTKKVKTVERIQTLLKKGLIYPYITLKNLGFQESIYLIIPDLNQDSVKTLIKIFSWFNYGFIHEIEGKYFIYGFDEPVEFTHGLMMKIYFPKCELSEFKQLFDMVFEYLQVDQYLILKDFVNGDTLVKNIYEDPNFFKTHHPLRNIKYDGKDV